MARRQGWLRLEIRGAVLAMGQYRSAAATFLPPSGFVAGVWGRNDDTRGVHKAPANEVVRGAVALETQITRKRARPAEPGGNQLHPSLPRTWNPGMGCAHIVV